MNSCRETTINPLPPCGEDEVLNEVWAARRRLHELAGPTTEDWIAFLLRRQQEMARGIPLNVPPETIKAAETVAS